MKVLMARLYQKRLDEQRAKSDVIEEAKTDIAWGHQIRSYVFMALSDGQGSSHQCGDLQYSKGHGRRSG